MINRRIMLAIQDTAETTQNTTLEIQMEFLAKKSGGSTCDVKFLNPSFDSLLRQDRYSWLVSIAVFAAIDLEMTLCKQSQ